MGREFELKFRATEAQQAAILEKYEGFRKIAMETTYYDTADRALSARRITLRQRKENGAPICTVKFPLPDGSKGEWELQWEDVDTMVDELCKLGAPAALRELTERGIYPICGAKFTRQASYIDLPGGAVELAVDKGLLLGGGKTLPLCEVEVELKDGEDAVAENFAAALAAEFDLQPEKRSKFSRAQQLAKGE